MSSRLIDKSSRSFEHVRRGSDALSEEKEIIAIASDLCNTSRPGRPLRPRSLTTWTEGKRVKPLSGLPVESGTSFRTTHRYSRKSFFQKWAILLVENALTSIGSVDCVSHAVCGTPWDSGRRGAGKVFLKWPILAVENLVSPISTIACVSHAFRGTPWDTGARHSYDRSIGGRPSARRQTAI